jgi:MFS family permease
LRAYLNAIKQFNRDALLFFLLWASVAFAYFGVQGVLVNLYLLRLGYGPEFIGFLYGAGQVVWAVFALPAGAIGARIGLKNAQIIAQVVTALGAFMFIMVEMLPTGWWQAGFMISWMVLWVGAALGAVNSAPYLMAVTTPETRSYAFPLQQAVMALSGAVGSLAAGWLPGVFALRSGLNLEQPEPYRLALLLAPAAYLLGGYTISRVSATPNQAEAPHLQKRGRAPIAILVFLGFVIFLQSVGEGTMRVFYNVYLDTQLNVPVARIGTIMSIAQLVPILSSMFAPALIVFRGSGPAVVVATLLYAACLFLLAGIPYWLAAALALMGLMGFGAIMGASRGIFGQELVDPKWRTMSSAVATIGLALGWAVSASAGGVLAGLVGFQGVFFAGAIFTTLSATVLFVYLRLRESPKARMTPAIGEGPDG